MYIEATYISILHPSGHGWGEDLEGLPDHGPSLDGMGLQQAVEHLKNGSYYNTIYSMMS